MWICDIYAAACVSKRGVTDRLWMFQTDRKQTMDLQRLGVITLSLIWRTLHKSGMPCARTAIGPSIPSQWNWILPSALYVQLYGIFISHCEFPVGPKSSGSSAGKYADVPYWVWCRSVVDWDRQWDTVSQISSHVKISRHAVEMLHFT